MHEMQTIVTVVRGVCLLVCPSVCHGSSNSSASLRGSFGAAFAKSRWLVDVMPRGWAIGKYSASISKQIISRVRPRRRQ